MSFKTIAKYYQVETFGVYEREVIETEMSWETWAEWIEKDLDVSVVSQTTTGTIIVHINSVGGQVEGFEALQQKAKLDAAASSAVAWDKESRAMDVTFAKQLTVSAVVGVILAPVVLYATLWTGLLTYGVATNVVAGHPVLEHTVFDRKYMEEIKNQSLDNDF